MKRGRITRLIKKAVISAVTAAAIFTGSIGSAGSMTGVMAEGRAQSDVREYKDTKLTGKTVVLHSGDVNGAVDGYSRIARLKSDMEKCGAEVLLVDAGGFSDGNTGEDGFRPIDGFTMMQAAGYTLSTLGENEFSRGYDSLRRDISGAKIRLVCANIMKDEHTLLMPGYLYRTGTGTKIGFVCLSDVQGAAGVSSLDGQEMYGAASSQIDSLKKDGADLVIGLSNLSTEQAADTYDNVKDIDFIINAGNSTLMTRAAGGEPIQSTGSNFAGIGVVVIDNEGSIADHYIISTDKLGYDEEVQRTADRMKERRGELSQIGSGESEAAAGATPAAEVEDTAEIRTAKKEEASAADTSGKAVSSGKDGEGLSSAEGLSDKEEQKTDQDINDTSAGTYEVVKGDCLWNIARKQLGDGARWTEIYQINNGVISNPDLIYPGQQLVMPPG